MSLQVWLPLNGDLRNQGLTSVTLSSGTPTYTNGKLGQCLNSGTLNFNVSDNLITSLGSTNIYSICCWCKNLNTSTSSRWVFVLSGGSGTSRGLWENNSTIYRHWAYSGSGVNVSTSINTIDGNWHHLCFTSSGGNVKLYVDGTYQSGITNGSTKAMTYDTFQLNATDYNLNDFRIYNHCLSESEVKRLAQGLMVHYPLNRQGLGQENLLRGTYDWSQWIVSSRASFSNEVATLVGSTADWGASIHSAHLNKSLLDGTTTYTWSFEYKSTVAWSCVPVIGGTATDIDAASNSRTKYCLWQTALDLPSTNGEWKKHVFTSRTITESQMTSSSGDVNSWFLQIYNRTDNASVQIRHIKLEKGSIATPWCPNIVDIDNIGLDSITEYDISGFGYNGTRINFPQQNLLLGTDFSTQYTTGLVTNNSTDWTKYLRGYNTSSLHTFNSGEDTITLSTASNLGVCFVRKATGINLDPNSYYTLSCEAKSTQTAKPLCIGLSYYNNSNTWIWRGGTNPTNFTTANTWQKFSLTFKPDADTQYICYCFTVVGVANSTDTFTIRHCKLEKGSVATPWVEDSYSGWLSNSPKYSISTRFNGSNYIKTLPGQLAWSNYDNLTIAAWMKPVTTPANWTGSIGIAHDGSYANKAVAISNYGGKFTIHIPSGTAWGTTQSTYTIPLNTWHHCVATVEGTVCKMYVDGVLNKTFTIDWGTATNHTSPQIEVGVDLPGSDEIYNGYYSDVRIYATALSAEDVKSLYQNCATIAADGTIYGQIYS